MAAAAALACFSFEAATAAAVLTASEVFFERLRQLVSRPKTAAVAAYAPALASSAEHQPPSTPPLWSLPPSLTMDVAAIAVFVQAFGRQLLLVPPPPFPLLLLSICPPPSSTCTEPCPFVTKRRLHNPCTSCACKKTNVARSRCVNRCARHFRRSRAAGHDHIRSVASLHQRHSP